MLDLDQRVADGLRELASRAPIDADVWPAAERHVTRRRRRRRSLGAGVVVIALLGVGVSAAVVVGHRDSKAVVASPVPPLPVAGPIEGFFMIRAAPSGQLVFQPSSVTVSTGIYAIELVGGSNTTHTLDFDDPTTLWSPLSVDTYGEVVSSRAFFGHAGDYDLLLRGSGSSHDWA